MTSGAPAVAVDLNADLGEGFPNDARLLELVTATSVCCGAHAGDPESIRKTLDAAAARGVAVGAHPGYPDREGFGRRPRELRAEAVESLILEQVGALVDLAAPIGVVLRFVKPHGALYNQAQGEEEVARGVVAAVQRLGLPVLGQPGGTLHRLAVGSGVRFVAEGFPDRRYDQDGRLFPRTRPDAIVADAGELESQVIRLASAGLATLCVHGDDPRAVTNAERLRAVLERHGVITRFWGDAV